MILSLNTPIGSNFIKDWPSQNTVNNDRIDDFAGPCLTSHGLQTYTPQFSAFTTDPVLGTGGFVRGFYYKIFDQIFTYGELRFGTAGINAGNGTWMVSLPFPVKSLVGITTFLGSTPVIGNGAIWDESSSAGRIPVTVHLRTATQMCFGFQMGTGLAFRDVRGAGPITWAIDDGLAWSARYMRDA